jgi:hypothetical protein
LSRTSAADFNLSTRSEHRLDALATEIARGKRRRQRESR